MQDLIAFSSRLEATVDVMSRNIVEPIVSDKPVKFSDSSLSVSTEIPPDAVRRFFLR